MTRFCKGLEANVLESLIMPNLSRGTRSKSFAAEKAERNRNGNETNLPT